MKTTKDIIKRILLEQAPPEGEEYSPPEGPHNDYYDVGLALRRIVVDPDNGNWIDTDYIEEESIETSWDLKSAEHMYQKKLYELKFFDNKGKMNEETEIQLKEDDKDFEINNIVHDRMDGFVEETFDRFMTILDDIEDELDEHEIDDDGFIYKTQLLFWEELVDLVDHCVEEIKHGIHHHHEMEKIRKGKGGEGEGTHH